MPFVTVWYNKLMNTETDTKVDDIELRGQTPAERLNMDIIDEMKCRSRTVDVYKNDKKMIFIELRGRGASYQDIADILKCSKTTLSVWDKELSEDIDTFKSMARQDILYAYQTAQDNRLRYFSELFNEIKAELKRRSLRDVPSDKLYVMLEKCSKCIDELSGIASAEKHDIGTKIATCVETTKTAVKCVSVAQA